MDPGQFQFQAPNLFPISPLEYYRPPKFDLKNTLLIVVTSYFFPGYTDTSTTLSRYAGCPRGK